MSKRAFILGAGFSKAAGFPLATELTDELLASVREVVGNDYPLFDFVNHVQRLQQWLDRSQSISALNIEQLYDYATLYAEIFRLEHHAIPVGRYSGETPYMQSETLGNWMSLLDEHLLEVLLKYEATAQLESIDRFTRTLRQQDAVVTFNYDRLMERSLTGQDQCWTLGLPRPDQSGIPVLKLHGSLDWVCFSRAEHQERSGVEMLFSKTDENRARDREPRRRTGEIEYDLELHRIKEDAKLRGFIEHRALVQSEHRWGVAGLGPRKQPSAVPGLGLVWAAAQKRLFEADQIIIVGFSFGEFDQLARIEFARVAASRAEEMLPAQRVIVIDPALKQNAGAMSCSGRALLNRIEAVFRPAVPVGLSHEEFDWSSLDAVT